MKQKTTKCFNFRKVIKKYLLKSTLVISVLTLSLIAPLTFPIFLSIAIVDKNWSYMSFPFIMLEIKTIITFIIDL